MAVLIRAVARHPVLAFMVISLGVYFLVVATRGQLGRAKESAATQTAVSDQDL